MRLLMIDNYDSFTYNLVQMFLIEGIDVEVYRNDEAGIDQIRARKPDWICISPGPGKPVDAGISMETIRTFGNSIPLLGICLGMQAINEAFGGSTTKAHVPVHGKVSLIHHDGRYLFAGLPSPLSAARYHSLQAADLPPAIEASAIAEDGITMALRHKAYPVWGVQFHPESFMTQHGELMIRNFLSMHPGYLENRSAHPQEVVRKQSGRRFIR